MPRLQLQLTRNSEQVYIILYTIYLYIGTDTEFSEEMNTTFSPIIW